MYLLQYLFINEFTLVANHNFSSKLAVLFYLRLAGSRAMKYLGFGALAGSSGPCPFTRANKSGLAAVRLAFSCSRQALVLACDRLV